MVRKSKSAKNGGDGAVDAFSCADIGDRVWLFFRENSRACYSALLIVAAVIIAAGLIGARSTTKISRAQRAYASIVTENDRANFLKKYGSTELGGLVLLALADEHLLAEKYERAKSEYAKAGKILRKSVLFPRTEISRAVATYGCGNFAAAEKILNSVILSKTFDKSFASDAACVLSAMMKDAGENEKLKRFVEKSDLSAFTQSLAREIRAICAEN